MRILSGIAYSQGLSANNKMAELPVVDADTRLEELQLRLRTEYGFDLTMQYKSRDGSEKKLVSQENLNELLDEFDSGACVRVYGIIIVSRI